MSTAHPLLPEARLLNGRDLACLVLALAIVGLPHALRAPWWLALLTLALYGWRAALLASHRPLPSRWVVLCIALAAMAGVWVEYRTVFARIPGIVLLLVFSGLKLMETRTPATPPRWCSFAASCWSRISCIRRASAKR